MKRFEVFLLVFAAVLAAGMAVTAISISVTHIDKAYGSMWSIIWFIIMMAGLSGAVIAFAEWLYEKRRK